MADSNGWSRHELLVLTSLARIEKKVDEQAEEIRELRTEVFMLKVKSGLWGAAAGFVPAMTILATILVRGM